MIPTRVGTIIHGAIGDCYEQLLAIRLLRRSRKNERWIGFFNSENRLGAMKHFDLEMLDEIYTHDKISSIDVDYFYQFQIKDFELNQDILNKLPGKYREKFDFDKVVLPWHILRSHDFKKTGLELTLSDLGKKYVPICMRENKVDPMIFKNRLTIGYLWRYRAGGAVGPYLQKSKKWILKTKSELFKKLITDYNAHIIICGMNKSRETVSSLPDEVKGLGTFVSGEYLAKFTDYKLDIPGSNCTYLKGYGYAAEMEIMSRCNLLIMMPSGFSEALWMKRGAAVILVDPPPVYTAKLWYNRMPFFNNYNPTYAYHNTLIQHTAANVINFLRKQKLINK